MGRLMIIIFAVSIITACFVLRKIYKSHFVIADTIYWIFFCLMLIIMSVFPNLTIAISNFIGFESTSNFIFVMFIFLLLIKIFLLSVKISKLEIKFTRLVQKYALDEEAERENKKS